MGEEQAQTTDEAAFPPKIGGYTAYWLYRYVLRVLPCCAGSLDVRGKQAPQREYEREEEGAARNAQQESS